jgi:hypothetical protein
MSQEHDKKSPDESSVDTTIHTESAPFEPSYHPDQLPKISVPDLSDDVQGLSAEALAQVPTLTELVDAPADPSDLIDIPTAIPAILDEVTTSEEMPEIQDTPAQADKGVEGLQVRMGRLTDDIHTLNARLDRLEERMKKV